MSDGEEMKRIIGELSAKESVLNLREQAVGIVRSLKTLGLDTVSYTHLTLPTNREV